MLVMIVSLFLLPMAAGADERLVRLAAPQALVESGLLRHILPRFSLKTAHRVEIVASGDPAEVALGPEGRALFQGAGAVWHLRILDEGHSGAKRFSDWLTSDIGMRTVMGFAPEGEALFGPPQVKAVEAVRVEIGGDAELGHEVSQVLCGRCHAVDEAGRKNSIGSTPSFFVLRSLGDWEERFAAFYVLKPHGAFTQIEDVTDPFPPERPSPIVPIEMTLDDLEAIMSYVAVLAAADLGKPLEHQ